ncbi:vitamin-D-receptor interacting mediator subunit 4-domain-containing protein [Aspergillus floccosus]
MNAQFQSALSQLESTFNALLTSLTTSPTGSGAPAAALHLLEADDSLTSAITTLRQHQQNYAKILRLRAQAETLEEQVKSIVREVVGYEKDIRAACGDDETASHSDVDSDSDDDADVTMEGVESFTPTLRHTKEVDYKLLLDFARRISKYNHQAAADAAAGAPPKKLPDADAAMTGTNGLGLEMEGAIEPVATVTKDATSWLDESAKLTRQVYMLPYPMEDRIRLGLMGQIQLAAAEGRPGFNPDQEVYRLIQEAEGFGVADGVAPAVMGEEARHAGEAAKAAAQAGSAASNAVVGGRPPAKPKATLDLDLYDPDDDDI